MDGQERKRKGEGDYINEWPFVLCFCLVPTVKEEILFSIKTFRVEMIFVYNRKFIIQKKLKIEKKHKQVCENEQGQRKRPGSHEWSGNAALPTTNRGLRQDPLNWVFGHFWLFCTVVEKR